MSKKSQGKQPSKRHIRIQKNNTSQTAKPNCATWNPPKNNSM